MGSAAHVVLGADVDVVARRGADHAPDEGEVAVDVGSALRRVQVLVRRQSPARLHQGLLERRLKKPAIKRG